MRFRFVHAADLHLDSPFRLDAGPHAAAFADATLRAFSRVVDVCLREGARFLVLAGDLFDARDRSVKARLFLRRELARLSDAGIDTLVVHGNHDPLSEGVGAIALPSRVHVFGPEWGEQVLLADGQPLCRVQGISYPRERVTENLSLRFGRRGPEFTIGLLHANVGANAGHANYAPCSAEELAARRLDYWALGHVHTRREWECGTGRAVYPGNPQGRHAGETGARGCVVVDVEGSGCRTRFVPVDVVRWHQVEVAAGGARDVAALLAEAERAVAAACTAESEASVVRVRLAGRAAVMRELGEAEALAAFEEELRHALRGGAHPVVLESVLDDLQAELDVSALQALGGLPAQLLARAEEGDEGFSRLVSEVDELSRLELQLRKLGLPPLRDQGGALLAQAVERAVSLLAEDA